MSPNVSPVLTSFSLNEYLLSSYPYLYLIGSTLNDSFESELHELKNAARMTTKIGVFFVII